MLTGSIKASLAIYKPVYQGVLGVKYKFKWVNFQRSMFKTTESYLIKYNNLLNFVIIQFGILLYKSLSLTLTIIDNNNHTTKTQYRRSGDRPRYRNKAGQKTFKNTPENLDTLII
jgi:hypothetical protein